MAKKKKVIVKATEEELEREQAKKEASKKVVKEREKGKKTKGKKTAVKDTAAKKSSKSKKTKEEIDALSIDEVVDEMDAFDEEEPSELEREMQASEGKFDEEIQEERIYTVPLAHGYMKAPKWKRTKKAVKVLSEFIARHMKPEALYIDPEVNERLWENGIKNPPRKVRVRVTKSVDGLVRVFLA